MRWSASEVRQVLFAKMQPPLARSKGSQDKAYLKLQEQISDELMNIRFTARHRAPVRLACAAWSRGARHERKILDLCVDKAACRAPTSSRCSPATKPTWSGSRTRCAVRQALCRAC
jgi:RNA polymerase primary sigma factor